jgi:ribosome maturation factor RimP
MSADLRRKLLALCEPLLAQLGYELVDLQLATGRAHAQLRVFIDRETGIAVEDCEVVSRELSALLDVQDPIPTAYTLEVSSPGLDRLLRTPAHFVRFVGERVHVELAMPRDGRRHYTGRLTASDQVRVTLEVDGVVVEIDLADIGRATLAPEWPESAGKRRR